MKEQNPAFALLAADRHGDQRVRVKVVEPALVNEAALGQTAAAMSSDVHLVK